MGIFVIFMVALICFVSGLGAGIRIERNRQEGNVDPFVKACKDLCDDHEFGQIGSVRKTHVIAARKALMPFGHEYDFKNPNKSCPICHGEGRHCNP